jgi:hypothetical protein
MISLVKLREDFDAAVLLFRPKSFSPAYPIQTAKKMYVKSL